MPSYYQILVNSLPSRSPVAIATSTPPTQLFDDNKTSSEGIGEEEWAESSEPEGVEPFTAHFEYNLNNSEVSTLKGLLGNRLELQSNENDVGLFKWLNTPIHRVEWTGPKLDEKPRPLHSLHVRQPMAGNWPGGSLRTPFQSVLFNALQSYKDMMFSCRQLNIAPDIRRLYVLHVLNHVIKSRAHILKNNSKMAAKDSSKTEDSTDQGEYRDQGITRPKVLILVPFKSCAVKIVEEMSAIMFGSKKGGVANKKRFEQEFGSPTDSKPPSHKPRSYLELFEGNTDDCFKLGISIKKNSINLYKKFYSSDVIIASPLGLRIVIGGEGDKKRDYDYLSSLEMVIVDQMDVFLMQNWDHLMHVLDHIHLQPKEGHGVDFSRVREWALEGYSSFYCQRLFFSDILTPEINSLVNKHFQNYEGQIRVTTPTWAGSVCQVIRPVPQVFHRFGPSSCKEISERRFSIFVESILPKLADCGMEQTCIYIPSYFDFVRIRNHLQKEGRDFGVLSEYSKQSSISRTRSYFSSGQKTLLLMTERLHFFRRYRINNIRHLVFYGIPTYQEFYSELINMMDHSSSSSSSASTVVSLYCQYDLLALQRVAGSSNACRMLKSKETRQTIVTG